MQSDRGVHAGRAGADRISRHQPDREKALGFGQSGGTEYLRRQAVVRLDMGYHVVHHDGPFWAAHQRIRREHRKFYNACDPASMRRVVPSFTDNDIDVRVRGNIRLRDEGIEPPPIQIPAALLALLR